MHTTRISAARKIIQRALAAFSLLLLVGCDSVTLTDLTPRSVAENPSQIYTFTLRVAKRSNTITGVSPTIVIDGRSFQMRSGTLGEGLYEFEYQLPAGRDRLAYYFLVTYNVEGNGVLTPREAYTQVETVQIVRRYVLSLEVNRGPVGARISVVGRGRAWNSEPGAIRQPSSSSTCARRSVSCPTSTQPNSPCGADAKW